jgi:hypothetical protein
MNRALEGAQGGDSILICGAPNYGKSQLQTSLFIQILRHNRDAMIVDFTLDDPARKRLTQYAAHLSRIPMNQIDFINRADPEDEFLLPRYEMAVEEIREWMSGGRLKLFQRTMQDRKGNRMLPCRIDFIRSAVARIRSTCPDKKLVLGLDALNNVIVDPSVTDEYVTARMVADQLEDILTENEAVLLGTGHLRKNDGRRPGLDDLKGNNFLAYDLKVAIGVYNDVKVHRDAAAVYWRDADDLDEIRRPIIEAHFLKSKVSDFNDVVCFHQWPALGLAEEAEPAAHATYVSRIYGQEESASKASRKKRSEKEGAS